jgi:hypothetical protein
MNTIYEQMLEVVEYYEAHQPLKKATVTVYKDLATQTELTTDAELLAAFKGGKALKDFEVVTDTTDPKKELNDMIFGEEKVKTLKIAKFFQIVGELTGVTVTAPEAAPKEAKEKSGYTKKYSALKAAIRTAKEKKDEAKKVEKVAELVQLVISNGKPPKSKFLYMKEYEAAIAAKK